MELDIYKDIKGVNETRQHKKFMLLKNNPQLIYEKKLLSSWTDGLIDRDKKFVREFQETFHSSFWEIFLYKLFTEAKFELDQSHQMPDFIIKSPKKVYVEAVVSNIKDGGRKEIDRNLDDQLSVLNPPYLQKDFYQVLDEAIIRFANAIKSKKEKFANEYIKYEWIDSNNPFIIAMGSYDQVNYGREFVYPMVALLYGLYFDVENEDFSQKEKIVKPETEAEILLGIFRNEEYNNISAIIYSCTVTLGKLKSLSISKGDPSLLNEVYNINRNLETSRYLLRKVAQNNPENIADGIFVFHNPNAKNKLPENFFKELAVTQFFYEDDYLNYLGNEAPIVARINTSKILNLEPEIIESLRKYNRMSVEDFYEIQE